MPSVVKLKLKIHMKGLNPEQFILKKPIHSDLLPLFASVDTNLNCAQGMFKKQIS